MFTLLRSTVSGNSSENRSFFELIVAEHRLSCCEGTVYGFGFANRLSFVCFATITLETELHIMVNLTCEGKTRMTLRKQKDNWKSKDEALGRTLWETRFGRAYGPVVRRTA